MNTNPDDEKLGLWLDDELDGDEFVAFEAMASERPEWLAEREECRRWKTWVSGAIPSSHEPPYESLFNARVAKGIRDLPDASPVIESRRPFRWHLVLLPMAAAAGMVMAFLLGARTKVPPVVEIDVSGAPRAIPVEPILYTPEKGVQATWFDSAAADALVIVLEGVPAIPDSVDFSKAMSALDEGDEARATADHVGGAWETEEGGGS